MPVRETTAKQVIGSKALVMIAKPFHPLLKKESAQASPPNSERSAPE